MPLGELGNNGQVLESLGISSGDQLPSAPPAEIIFLGGIRTGKSLFAAALAVRASQTCDLSKLRAGEIPRVPVVSTGKDQAKAVFDHAVGSVTSNPILRGLLVGEPTADTLVLRHPSGTPVEITVTAGARAGSTLVGRWLAGCIFDEAPRMIGSGEGVVNYDDARSAVLGRILPGGQIISLGSPWAPTGPIYDRVKQFFGSPTEELVIIKAPAPYLNPYYWTPKRCEDLRRRDPIVYRTDVLAEFADPESSLFPSTILDDVTRKGAAVLPPDPHCDYVAAMDPATRGNSWTFVICTKQNGIKRVVYARQWTGTKGTPLSPEATMREIAEICMKYRVDAVHTDQWATDALKDIAYNFGMNLVVHNISQASKIELFENLRINIIGKKVELPNDRQLLSDLRSVRKRITQAAISIVLPRTNDGRHADFAPALAMVLAQYVDDELPEGIQPGTPDYYRAQALKEKFEHIERGRARKERDDSKNWWEGF